MCMIYILLLYRGEFMESKIKTSSNNSYLRKSQKPLYIDMGKRLRILRIELNYTQEQMAEILEMSSAYYGKIERGIHGLSLDKLVIVNKKLDIDINYLLTGHKESNLLFEKLIEECPKSKRYDLEQLIRYAINLSKEVNSK